MIKLLSILFVLNAIHLQIQFATSTNSTVSCGIGETNQGCNISNSVVSYESVKNNSQIEQYVDVIKILESQFANITKSLRESNFTSLNKTEKKAYEQKSDNNTSESGKKKSKDITDLNEESKKKQKDKKDKSEKSKKTKEEKKNKSEKNLKKKDSEEDNDDDDDEDDNDEGKKSKNKVVSLKKEKNHNKSKRSKSKNNGSKRNQRKFGLMFYYLGEKGELLKFENQIYKLDSESSLQNETTSKNKNKEDYIKAKEILSILDSISNGVKENYKKKEKLSKQDTNKKVKNEDKEKKKNNDKWELLSKNKNSNENESKSKENESDKHSKHTEENKH